MGSSGQCFPAIHIVAIKINCLPQHAIYTSYLIAYPRGQKTKWGGASQIPAHILDGALSWDIPPFGVNYNISTQQYRSSSV